MSNIIISDKYDDDHVAINLMASCVVCGYNPVPHEKRNYPDVMGEIKLMDGNGQNSFVRIGKGCNGTRTIIAADPGILEKFLELGEVDNDDLISSGMEQDYIPSEFSEIGSRVRGSWSEGIYSRAGDGHAAGGSGGCGVGMPSTDWDPGRPGRTRTREGPRSHEAGLQPLPVGLLSKPRKQVPANVTPENGC